MVGEKSPLHSLTFFSAGRIAKKDANSAYLRLPTNIDFQAEGLEPH